jgi:carboxylate-amine ligase
MDDLVFNTSASHTLGVELEFQLVDRATFDLVPRVQSVIDAIEPGNDNRITREFLQSIIEIQTGICNTVTDVAHDLSRSIQIVEDAAEEENCILYSASLHPFAAPGDQKLTDGKRYARIMDELQYVGRQFISQGLHVHVGVGNADTAIKICDIIQGYLPILLAMSTSSPYFCGEDTGFFSYRSKLFEALPLAGFFGYIGDWQGFATEVAFLKTRGIIKKVKDLWWDVRPSPGYGTVEIRICDMPARFSEVLGIAAVVQALVACIAENRKPSARISLQLLRSNKWQAARHGLEGMFNDSFGLLTRQTQSLRSAAEELLDLLQPFTVRFQSQKYITPLRDLLQRGTGAEFQRLLVRQGQSYEMMISRLRNDYWLW